MDIMALQDLVTSKIQNMNLTSGNQKTGKTEGSSDFDFTAAFQNYSLTAGQTQTTVQTSDSSKADDAQNAYQVSNTGMKRLDRNASQTEASKNDPDRNDLSGEDVKTLQEFKTEVVKEISESTGVDEDAVEKAMEVLGLTVADLLNPQNLAGLVTELTGESDPSAMLLNENFTALMSDISDMAQNLADALDVNSDEMNEILSNFDFTASVEPEDEKLFQNILDSINPGESEMAVNSDASAETLPQTAEPEENENDVIASEPVITDETAAQNETSVVTVETTEKNETDPVSVKEDRADEKSSNIQTAEDSTSETEEKTIEVIDRRTAAESNREAGRDSSENEQQNHENAISQPVVSNETPSVENTQTADFVQAYTSVDQLDILEQVTSNLKISLANSETTMEMQLNPENLGKVYLQVTAKEGNVTAQLTTQNEVVKEALEAQLATLRENLNTQGVKVDAIEVTVSSHGFEKNLEDGQHREQEEGRQAEENNQRRSIRMDSLDELSGLMTEEEMLVAQIMHDNGNSMDLTA